MPPETLIDMPETRSDNPAVTRCRKAYSDAFAAAQRVIEERRRALLAERDAAEDNEEDEDEFDLDDPFETFGLPVPVLVARNAYRQAMPALAGETNIRDFIAAVTDGALLGVIPQKEHTKLLYAAQVALSAERALQDRR